MTEARESAALKPCPHCHAPGYFVWNRTQSRGRVKCTRVSCGATGGEFERSAEAIAAWNTRVSADLEAVREACAKVAEVVDLFAGDRLKNSDPRKTIAAAIRNTDFTKGAEG